MPPAIDLREKAAGLFKEAHDLVEGKDVQSLSDEQLIAFNQKMAEARTADEEYVKASEGEAGVLTLKERLDYYSGKATGNPIPWSRFQIEDGDRLSQKSLGQRFVESETYEELQKSGALSSNMGFKTAPFTPEVKAATDIISGTAAASGDRLGAGHALILPDFRPGILPL